MEESRKGYSFRWADWCRMEVCCLKSTYRDRCCYGVCDRLEEQWILGYPVSESVVYWTLGKFSYLFVCLLDWFSVSSWRCWAFDCFDLIAFLGCCSAGKGMTRLQSGMWSLWMWELVFVRSNVDETRDESSRTLMKRTCFDGVDVAWNLQCCLNLSHGKRVVTILHARYLGEVTNPSCMQASKSFTIITTTISKANIQSLIACTSLRIRTRVLSH